MDTYNQSSVFHLFTIKQSQQLSQPIVDEQLQQDILFMSKLLRQDENQVDSTPSSQADNKNSISEKSAVQINDRSQSEKSAQIINDHEKEKEESQKSSSQCSVVQIIDKCQQAYDQYQEQSSLSQSSSSYFSSSFSSSKAEESQKSKVSSFSDSSEDISQYQSSSSSQYEEDNFKEKEISDHNLSISGEQVESQKISDCKPVIEAEQNLKLFVASERDMNEQVKIENVDLIAQNDLQDQRFIQKLLEEPEQGQQIVQQVVKSEYNSNAMLQLEGRDQKIIQQKQSQEKQHNHKGKQQGEKDEKQYDLYESSDEEQSQQESPEISSSHISYPEYEQGQMELYEIRKNFIKASKILSLVNMEKKQRIKFKMSEKKKKSLEQRSQQKSQQDKEKLFLMMKFQQIISVALKSLSMNLNF